MPLLHFLVKSHIHASNVNRRSIRLQNLHRRSVTARTNKQQLGVNAREMMGLSARGPTKAVRTCKKTSRKNQHSLKHMAMIICIGLAGGRGTAEAWDDQDSSHETVEYDSVEKSIDLSICATSSTYIYTS